MNRALRHLEANKDRYLRELFELLRLPSVSAQSAHRADTRRAAEWVRTRLDDMGFRTELYEGPRGEGCPTVLGQRHDDLSKPTLLLYGHYDVQPPDPLDEWETPPFEPTLRDGMIRARGCADDKGPTLAMLLGAECWIEAAGKLPVNLKVVIEGEEESGGKVVHRCVAERREELRADALVIADVPGAAPGVPSICYGLRGLVALEVTVRGPARDLHSGFYGGTVMNPATALARLLATLHDEAGRVAVKGFYDDVRALDRKERERLLAQPIDDSAWLEGTGAAALFGEEGFTTAERMGARPTCEVNGIFGGYMGEGAKTIIPAKAGCKITCRLVPDQDPDEAGAAVERHLKANCPYGVTLEVQRSEGAPAFCIDPDTDWARRAAAALESAFGKAPVFTRGGGSIPIIAAFKREVGLDPLLLGTYAPGERMHSPNERYSPDDFFRAIQTAIALYGS